MAPWLHRCLFLVRYSEQRQALSWSQPGCYVSSSWPALGRSESTAEEVGFPGILAAYSTSHTETVSRVWRMNSNLFLLLCLWFFVWKKHRVCDAFHLWLLWFLLLVKPLYLVCKKPCLFPFEIVNSTRIYPQERATFFLWVGCLPSTMPPCPHPPSKLYGAYNKD